jgi:hypothetical protein
VVFAINDEFFINELGLSLGSDGCEIALVSIRAYTVRDQERKQQERKGEMMDEHGVDTASLEKSIRIV